MLRFLTAGESHGECLSAILDGMPAGLAVDKRLIDADLARRQTGYGRGGRMAIEQDKVKIISGLRKGVTIGSPISLQIKNKDFKIDELPAVTHPRPGHADLAGALKYDRIDVRDILERASARETAARTAVGSLCKIFLEKFDIRVVSHVVELGGIRTGDDVVEDAACGDGPVDAACKTIDRITGIKGKLSSFSLRAVTSGKDAIGEVFVRVDSEGLTVSGRGASTDIIEASAKAYVNAINHLLYMKGRKIAKKPSSMCE